MISVTSINWISDWKSRTEFQLVAGPLSSLILHDADLAITVSRYTYVLSVHTYYSDLHYRLFYAVPIKRLTRIVLSLAKLYL